MMDFACLLTFCNRASAITKCELLTAYAWSIDVTYSFPE